MRSPNPSNIATGVIALGIAAAATLSAISDPGEPRPASGARAAAAPTASALQRAAKASEALRPPTLTRMPCGSGGRLISFRVEIDARLPVTPNELASGVREVLCDARSWIASERVRFRYHPEGSLLIGLRSPEATQRRCFALGAGDVKHKYSCASPREVALNSARWIGGSPTWDGSIPEYRRMLVNHEVGHSIGLGHTMCARDGAPAPVMMQQSKGMKLNAYTCVPNPWPLAEELARVG